MSIWMIIVFLPLIFGVWFAFFPTSVPGFILTVPLYFLEVSTSIIDWVSSNRYDYRTQTPVSDPAKEVNFDREPDTIRIVGIVLIFMWFFLALLFRDNFHQPIFVQSG